MESQSGALCGLQQPHRSGTQLRSSWCGARPSNQRRAGQIPGPGLKNKTVHGHHQDKGNNKRNLEKHESGLCRQTGFIAGAFEREISQSPGEVFTAQGRGLFPSPQEIGFDCSCPDWAYMCKHVAATLYGIGTRLDDDAGLFFKLRKVKIDDLIQQTLKDQSYKLLEKAEKMSPGKIAESDLSGMFGIDMEETMDLDLPETTKKVSGAGKKSP